MYVRAVLLLIVILAVPASAVADEQAGADQMTAVIAVDPGSFKGLYKVGAAIQGGGCAPDVAGYVTGPCRFRVPVRPDNEIGFATGWGGAAIAVGSNGTITKVVPPEAVTLSADRKSMKFNTETFVLSAGAYDGVLGISLLPGQPFKLGKGKSLALHAVRGVVFSVSNGDDSKFSRMSVTIDAKGDLRSHIPVGAKSPVVHAKRELALATAPVWLQPNACGSTYVLSGFGRLDPKSQAKYDVVAGLLTSIKTLNRKGTTLGHVSFYPKHPMLGK